MGDTKRNHDSRISAVKAICIILMVVGHSGCPQPLSKWIYLFHMPCFFFVSGFLLKDKYLADIWTFVKRRFKGLWWPFVKWSLLFLLLHNVFAALHLYETRYTWSDFLNQTFHILTLTGSEQLLGGYWFLKELLYASLISIFSLKLVSMALPNVKSGGVILTVLFLLAAYVLSVVPFKIPTVGSKTLLAAAFYMAGYSYNKFPFSRESRWPVALGCLLALVAVSFFFHGSMDCRSTDIFIYFVVALVGTVGMVHLAGKITGRVQRALDYAGSKTLYILTFHFISFKLVSLLKIAQYGMPVTALSAFPVIAEYNAFYWVLYSVVGTLLPILIWEVVHRLEALVKAK